MPKEVIRLRALPLAAFDKTFQEPFLSVSGRISEYQVPELTTLLSADAKLLLYEFLRNDRQIGYVLVQVRHRILADVQFGPVLADSRDFGCCVNELKGVLRKKGLFLLRVMPPAGVSDYPGLPGLFHWATLVVDLKPEETDILKSFSSNHRQSIKKAHQTGILVKKIERDELQQYAELHTAMFTRRGIVRNVPDTLRLVTGLYNLSEGEKGSVFILTARQQDGPMLGAAIFLRSGDTCTYYHGFAERGDPSLPVLHSLIWEAMKEARRRGCTRFDMCGYSLDPGDQQLKAVNDFKRWFRGELIENPKTVVIPLWPGIGALLKISGKRL